MIDVTPNAIAFIQQYLLDRDVEPSIRIDLISIGSNWQSLALRLDTATEDDTVVRYRDINFLVESLILEYCGSITIDYIRHSPETEHSNCSGFSISTQKPLL